MVLERLNTGMLVGVSEVGGRNEHVLNEGRKLEETNGIVPVGLGRVRIIPTGSVFVPRELILPQTEESKSQGKENSQSVLNTKPLIPVDSDRLIVSEIKSNISSQEQAIPNNLSMNGNSSHLLDVVV